MALTDIKVRTAKPTDKQYKLTDGSGMHLLVHPNGSKYWRLQYRFDGKQKMLALGVYPEITLADARARRDEARKLLANGVDPGDKKKNDKVEQSKARTFKEVAIEWHGTNKKWSEDHAHRVLKSLEDNLFALRVMGYDTKVEVGGHGFRTMACSSLIESRLWSKDAVERQMSHMERNSVRAAYIHKAEFIDERKLMLQWWADFLDANREKGITPFDYAKINQGHGE
ncbi:TPA: tyrosine-type recombinase/integrase [Klebsiella variicola]|uniref:tyrosine-type recombinase/integrase n=1 Tax=Klebsiella variicola TaxID=244366 RepID=UPI0034DF2C7D